MDFFNAKHFFSAEAIRNNTRRFITLASEAVWDLLPDYREHEPPARDALDVYINHRTLMEARTRNPGENRPTQNAFPPELMRRFEVNFKVKLFGTLGLGYSRLGGHTLITLAVWHIRGAICGKTGKT